ncbi:MAG: LysR family transcriptional regulator [Parachlamydiaceae bacterium]|nr:LysR family transcriptional regulator [Parachlamydiaceae bacterium]
METPINLIHLKFFCDAVLFRSITESAKMNFVTQSTVSQAIRKLESVLGVELISHSHQKFQVTSDGIIVFEQARHVFKSVQQMRDSLHNKNETIRGVLKIVCTNSLGMSFITPIYQQMQIKFPAVEIKFQLGGLNFIRNALRQGDADIGIVVFDKDFDQFSKHLLKKGMFNLYQHQDAPFHLIENGILVDHAQGMHVSSLLNYFIESDRSSLNIQTELAGWEVIARFTESKIGVGFFPDYITDNGRYPYLKIYPQELPSFDYEICAIYNKGEKLSRAVTAFFSIFDYSSKTSKKTRG